ncbi:hypothetical protein [Streptomyces sp. NPDC127084]|uniref:hypothetical protein n=1 Tax=Streptomyces sp. NPDC127084 TaxID=3347133 RepID=UPI00364FBAE6
MSEPQDTGAGASADDPRRQSMTAVLSRHWKLAVMTAAGLATVAASTTLVAVNHREATAGAQATAALTDSKGDHDKGKDKGDHDKGKDKGGHDKGGEGHKSGHDKDGHGDSGDHDKSDDKYGGHPSGDATYVECDPNELIVAILDLNSDSGGELVLAKDCKYTLTVNEDENGLPVITQPITIHGNGATIQRAANGDSFRIFDVGPGGDLKLSHLTITRGKLESGSDGGGIRVTDAGRLHLDHVTLTRNSSDLEESNGGAIYNEGITDIHRSTLSKNTGEDGAAVYNDQGKLNITESKITGNVSDADDGYAALYNDAGTLKVSKSLVGYNYAYYGGGIYNSYDGEGGTTEINRSAVVYNHAYYGGGLYSDEGSLVVRDSTIAYNTTAQLEGELASGVGGGVYLQGAGAATFVGSKIYANTAATNGGGIYTDLNDEAVLSLRDSKVSNNQAPGNGAMGGGIFVGEGDEVRLIDTKVTGNISDEPAGGVHNLGEVTTYGKVKIIDNVPTNCEAPGTNPVPNCFG